MLSSILESVLPGKAKDFLKTGGINLEAIFGLLSGGATPRKVAQTVTPIVTSISPALGDSLEFLSKKYEGNQIMLQVYNTTDDDDKRVTGFSVVRLNPTNGQVEYLENYQFDYLPNFIVDKMEENKQLTCESRALPGGSLGIGADTLPAA
jgi:hypothetical protein